MRKKLNNIYIIMIDYNIYIHVINKRLGNHRVVKYKIVPKNYQTFETNIKK